MDRTAILDLLQQIATGHLSPHQGLEQLENLPFEDLDYAHVDHHRSLRTGYPETIFCQGKTAEQILGIAQSMVSRGSLMLATRVEETAAEALRQHFPRAECDPVARTVVVRPESTPVPSPRGLVAVVSAGTSDLPVAREAIVTAETMNAQVEPIFDVGVAGIHRLLAYRKRLRQARAIVVVAGMEGALASVVGGLVDAPVIAVPTSVGYGASFNGLAALLTMLNSCATGVSVVNIDNGYGAGYTAALINNRTEETE